MISSAIGERQHFAEPFPYFVATQALAPDFSLAVLEWLERDAPWHLIEAEFYEQYEFSLRHDALPEEVRSLVSPQNLDYLRGCVEESFQVQLAERIDVTAHKLVSGQTIRVHNDYIPDRETHRILIQLNRGWNDENGGLLIFFNSNDPADMNRAFRPEHNSCVGFAISPRSNHAVSTVHSGERFTLVYSFYR